MTVVDQKVAKISKGKVRRALKRMKSGKVVGPDDMAVDFLTRTFNKTLGNKNMPEE